MHREQHEAEKFKAVFQIMFWGPSPTKDAALGVGGWVKGLEVVSAPPFHHLNQSSSHLHLLY